MLVQILREALVCHQVANSRALFSAEWKRIDLLLLLIERLNAVREEIGRKRMQFIWSGVFPVDYDKGAIEIRGAVNLELVGVGVAGKAVAVTFEE